MNPFSWFREFAPPIEKLPLFRENGYERGVPFGREWEAGFGPPKETVKWSTNWKAFKLEISSVLRWKGLNEELLIAGVLQRIRWV